MSGSDAKPDDVPQVPQGKTPSAEQMRLPANDARRSAEELIGPSASLGSTRTYAVTPPHQDGHSHLRVEDLKLDPPRREGSLGRLEHYEVLQFVGRGAMGIVLKAFDEQLHRQVAIKVMSPDLIARPSARERFFREARAAAGINHPNVVTIHAVSEYRGLPYLVMEYVSGVTLAERIHQQTPMPLHDLLRISVQIADGLEAAHRHGIIHRDIKPANIMLEAGIDRVKIADFGLARVVIENSDLTSLGDMIGTPAFMSPEQVDGLELSPRSDLFSFGCVIFAMVAGKSPFRSSNALATARKVCSEPHPKLLTVCKTVPTYLSDVVDRLLMKKPEDRFESAEKVYQALTIRLAEMNQGLNEAATLLAKQVHEPSKEAAAIPKLRLGVAAVLLSAALVFGLVEAVKFWQGRSNPRSPESTGTDRNPFNNPEKTDSQKATVIGVQPANSPPDTRQESVTVAADGSADVSSLAEALRRVRPGGVVRVLDDARYDEAVRVDSSERWDGVTLEATNQATLTAPKGSILSLLGVRNVTVRGFRIETRGLQHAIEITQSCPGLTIQDCQIGPSSPSDSKLSMIYLHNAAAGEKEAPIRIRDCVIDYGSVGIVIGGHDESDPVRQVVVERCRLIGGRRVGDGERGVALVLLSRVSEIQVTRNILAAGTNGMNLAFSDPTSAQDVAVAWNTFHDFHFVVGLPESAESCFSKVRFESNLFLSCSDISGSYSTNMLAWFKDNVWERGGDANESHVSQIARWVEPIALRSRDRKSLEYLMPDESKLKELPGRFAPEKVGSTPNE